MLTEIITPFHFTGIVTASKYHNHLVHLPPSLHITASHVQVKQMVIVKSCQLIYFISCVSISINKQISQNK